MHYRPPVLLCFQLRIRCTSFLYLNVSVNSSSQNTVQVFTLDCPWIIPGLAVLSLSFLWVPRQGSSEFVLGAPRSSEIAAITIRECSDDIYRESFVSLHCIELCVAFFGSRQRPLVGRERQWAGKSCWWIVSSDLWEQVRLQTAYASEEVVRLMFFFCYLFHSLSYMIIKQIHTPPDHYQIRSNLRCSSLQPEMIVKAHGNPRNKWYQMSPSFPQQWISVERNHLQQHNIAAVVTLASMGFQDNPKHVHETNCSTSCYLCLFMTLVHIN